MIVPCHAGYVVKQHAQDHAMAHAGVVAAAGDRRYDTAACIQASQGGFIKKGSYRMLILPHALREHALQKRGEKNYQKAVGRHLGVQPAIRCDRPRSPRVLLEGIQEGTG